MRALYTLLLRLALPLVLVVLWWKGRGAARRVDHSQRLALYPAAAPVPPAMRPVWVHGVSVGEVQAAAVLLRHLHARDSARPLLLTTATATGHERATRLLGDMLAGTAPALRLCQAPFDLPGAARRFLRHHQPAAAVFLETELWPNLIAALHAQRVPVAIASARVSQRSVARYLRFAPRLIASTLSRLHLVAAQTPADAARFASLGVAPATLRTTGNVKFDFALPDDILERGRELRARYAPARPLWVAGSTHAGEEQACLEAQRELARRAAEAGSAAPMLVLAPRHPERFAAVAKLLGESGLAFARRSRAQEDPASAQVLLVDGLGELLAFYAASDAAFVGGSLVPIGGHNLLEPAALARPVLTGPHSFNAPEAARLLEAADALVRVHDAHGLAQAVWEALVDAGAAARRGQRAAAAVEANRGAAALTLAALAESGLLPPVTGPAASGSAAAPALRP